MWMVLCRPLVVKLGARGLCCIYQGGVDYMKAYHTCGSWDLSPFVWCIKFYYCIFINIFYFPLILFIGLKNICSCPVLSALLFLNILKIFTGFILLLFCTRYMFYSNPILLYLIFYNVYKSLYEGKKLIFEGTSTCEVNVSQSLFFFFLIGNFPQIHTYFSCVNIVFFSTLYVGMYFDRSGSL